jgi:SH3-like domain-containing protein
MKLKAWLISALTPLTALSVLAQTSNTLPPVMPPPSSTAATSPEAEPAAKPKAKHTRSKAKPKKAAPAATNSVIVLDPPVTAAVKCNVLDVRGQGSFVGEIITYLKKGENVTVLEEITLGHPHANEPAQWSRIVMPANTAVWVDDDYIDADSMTVRAKKVNVRGGPGENYSVVARLERGAVVKEIGKKENWLEIVAPTNAYAFVASEYLETSATPAPRTEIYIAPPAAPAEPTPVATAPPTPAPVVVNVPADTAPAVAKPEDTAPPAPAAGLTAPAPTAASQSDQELAALHRATAPEPLVSSAAAPAATPPEAGKTDEARIVTMEGFVHRALNIQAPAGYELHDIKTGVMTEYLQPAPGQKSFKVFVGTRVRITGAEFLDPAWPRTPILHVETVDLMP